MIGRWMPALTCCIFVSCMASIARPEAGEGYYRFPSIHKNVIVFSAEGDLWRVTSDGGIAQRLTSHASEEILQGAPRVKVDA